LPLFIVNLLKFSFFGKDVRIQFCLLFLLLLLPLVPPHAATEWTNGWFSTTREAPGSLGQPLGLGVREDQYNSGASGMNLSHILTPTGATWHISGEGPEVTDGEGIVVAGVTGSVDGHTATISVEAATEEHLGNWIFYVVSDIDGFQYGLVITTAELVTDVRLPTAVLPLHYQVRLIPDFEATEGSRIRYDGNVEMFVEVVAETPIFTFHMDELTPDTEWLLQDDPPMVQKQEADGSILNVTVSRITFDFQRTFVHFEL